MDIFHNDSHSRNLAFNCFMFMPEISKRMVLVNGKHPGISIQITASCADALLSRHTIFYSPLTSGKTDGYLHRLVIVLTESAPASILSVDGMKILMNIPLRIRKLLI